VANEVADPECRSVAQRAYKELNRVGNEGKTAPPKKKDPAAVAASLKALIAARAPAAAVNDVFAVTLAYVGTLCAALQDIRSFDFDEWNGAAAGAYLSTFIPEADAEAVSTRGSSSGACSGGGRRPWLPRSHALHAGSPVRLEGPAPRGPGPGAPNPNSTPPPPPHPWNPPTPR
jgi:hypothetical protein